MNFDDLPIGNKHHHHNSGEANNFDDVPIGNNYNKFAISEYAEGQIHEPTKSTANMTLEEKIQSKAVKIKLQGLEQLKAVLNDTGKCGDIQIQLAKILKENNPACLEKALQCAEKWMELNKIWGEKQIKEIIENGCVNGKGATKKLATDLIFKAFESKPEQVQRTILEIGLKGKVPKIVGGYLAVVNQMLQQFGIKDLKYLKPYISSVVHVMNNQKLPVVKAEGMNLFKSGLKWLGKDFLWPMFGDLKENMKKQLETFWEGHDKKQVMKANRQKTVQNVPIKSENGPKSKSAKQIIKTEVESFQPGGLDIYQISDPIEVLQKFDEKWTQSVLEAEKWNVKTTLLQQIITKTSIPKIANTQHRHITEMIRRLLNDSNFNVVLAVIKLSGCLAKSLRRNFAHSAKLLFPYITPKFRDKKTQMIEQTYNTLNNFSYCLSLEEVSQDIKTALKDKTVGMKNNIIKWMTLFIQKRQSQPGSERLGQFFKTSAIQSIIENLLNDPSPQVRDSTTKLVCKVRAIYGDSMFKNVDKNISNKDILQKLSDWTTENQQPLSKSRNKQSTSNKKQKSQSKNKSSSKKQQDQQYESTNKNTYTIKTNSKGYQTIDITEQLNKNLKKLNDNTNWQNRKQSAERMIKYFNQIQNTNVKIVSPVLYDFLGVLKARIADPNKQLIKIFVGLIGQVFKYLSEKQAKIQSKFFMQELIEAYSDKNQVNRKQINKTFDSISTSIGHQMMINLFGQILTQEIISSSASNQSASITKQFTLQYLLNSPYFLNRVDQIQGGNLKEFKQYPKIILTGLCDKNKDLRSVSEKMFKLISEKTGIQIFRSFVNSKQQKSTFKGDLTAFLDKFQGTLHDQPSIISYGSNISSIPHREEVLTNNRSPSMNKSKIVGQPEAADKSRRKLSNVTSLCNSRSKGKNNSVLGGQENSKDFTSNLSFYLKGDAPSVKKIVQGENFASLQTLTSQRIQRQQSSTKYRNAQSHPISQQSQIQSSISRLLNHQQLYQKMYSNDYNKNLQACQKIIKLCRDVSQTNSIRQIYDLLIKWVVIKLYGGNVTAMGLIQLICPVLSVLEKKRIGWTEADIQVLVYLVREYMIGMFYDGNQNIEVLKNIFKLAIALSSGERILRKILNQLRSDINQYHRHLAYSKRQGMTCNKYYKKYLTQICCFFIDYFSNDGLLGQAAAIPQLSQDQDFVRLLSNKFHEGVLKEFGFKFCGEKEKQRDLGIVVGVNLQRSFINAEKSINSPRDSPIAYFGGDKTKNDQKTKKVTPQKKPSTPNLNESQFPPPSPISKVRSIAQSIIQPSPILKKQPISIPSLCRILGIEPFSDRYQIDTSNFIHPSHHNPLGSNLNKLYPYNQSTIHFFSTLFQPQNQNSDKITSQLSTHCNLIYSTLINTLIKVMQITNRQTQGPQKISIYMSLIQHSIKCPSIYKNLTETLIQKSIRYIIDQLVFQDQNRNTIQMRLRTKGFNQFKNDVFVKGINGIMLRLLDNSYPLFLVNVLLFSMMEVLIGGRGEDYYGGSVNRSKKLGLLIRCFNRVTTTYFAPTQKQKQPQNIYNIDEDPTCLKTQHIHKFLLLTKQYLNFAQVTDLAQFQHRQTQKMQKTLIGGNGSACTTNNNNEETVILCICKIIKVLGRKNLLMKNYEQVKKQRGWSEKTVGDYVSTVCGGLINNNLDYNYTGSNSNYHQVAQINNFTPKIDEELKKIVQMLSKVKTFQEGVKNLKLYIQQSGGKFDYKNVFAKMNFQPAFIERVTEQMGKLNILSSQSSSRSLNPDIQNKLEKLKMKLEGINSEHSRSISTKIIDDSSGIRVNNSNLNLTTISISTNKTQEVQTPRGRQISSRSIEQSSIQNDMKKRIQEMKNKVSMSTSNNISGNTQRMR